MDNKEKLDDLRLRKNKIAQMGGDKSVKKQHEAGKLTVRERIGKLVDPFSFHEIDSLVKHRCIQFGMAGKEIPGDALVSGYGTIKERPVFLGGEDFTTFAGTYGEAHGQKLCKVLDLAFTARAPFIQMIDSGGARLQEGQDSSEWYAQVFRRHTLYNGIIPQISLLMGHCGGGAAYGPALTDFIIMVKGTSFMYMGGPAFVKTLLGYDATADELGGTAVHSKVTGLCDIVADSDEHAIELAKELLGFLPQNNMQSPPYVKPTSTSVRKNTGIMDILPSNSKLPFDMKKIITQIVDDSRIFEIKADFAKNMITCFARLDGNTIGIVANQPLVKGGVIDVDASDKLARFVRICDSYNIPLFQFQDSPAVMIGREEEFKGIIRHGSKMLYAYTEASVPKITLVIRKSYAGAQLCMCNKPMGADLMFAWPTAEITLVGPETAASVIFAKEISSAPDPGTLLKSRVEEFAKLYVNPYVAAERGYIDDVIEPEDTRVKLISALNVLKNKKQDRRPDKKHANMQM
jgi:acetyl-CoA carboxylase carboxyltransferase component